MDVVLNELSLEAQYTSDDAFFSDLQKVLQITTLLGQLHDVVLLKNSALWSRKVTDSKTLQDILYGKGNPLLTKLKSNLLRLAISPPYWDTEQRHICPENSYVYDGSDICNSGLAESVEREQLVLSFEHRQFKNEHLQIEKNTLEITIDNFLHFDATLHLLLDRSVIDEHVFCKYYFHGRNLNFSLLEESRGFMTLSTEQKRQFITQLKVFSQMSWESIGSSDGLQYKRYENTLVGFETKNIYKFRVSQLYRCYGFRVDDIFHVVHFEVDHVLSDKG